VTVDGVTYSWNAAGSVWDMVTTATATVAVTAPVVNTGTSTAAVLGIKASPVFSGDGTNNIVEFKKSNGVTRAFLSQNGSDLYVGANTAESGSVQIGYGATGNQYAYIDLIGDTTYTDYGARLIRINTGPNTDTSLEHRGTGALAIQAPEGVIRMTTANTTRLEIANNGHITMPAQPVISGSLTNLTTLNAVATYFFPLVNKGFTIGADRITVPTAGNYLVTYNTISNSSTGRVDASVNFNGINSVNVLSEDNGTGFHLRSLSIVRELAANDFIQFYNSNWYSNSFTGYNEWRTFSITKLS
jgi:hypothetical protein